MYAKMKILTIRPLAVGCASFLILLFSCLYVLFPFCAGFAAASAILSAFMMLIFAVSARSGSRLKRFSALSFSSGVVLFLSSLAFLLAGTGIERLEAASDKYSGKSLYCEYVIEDVAYHNRAATATLRLLTADSEPCDLMVSAMFFGSELPEPFTVAKGNLSFSDITDGDGLSSRYNLSKGCLLAAEASSFDVTDDASGAYAALGRLRIHIRDMFSSRLDEDASGLMTALFTADRSMLDDSIKSSFGDLGISHLLAVSGMHLSVLAGFAGLLFSWLKMGIYKKHLLLSIMVVLYAAVTAFAPSMLRSAGMLLLFYLSFYLGRRSHAVTSLLFSVFLICAVSPFSIFDSGLLMSFSATMGIIVISSSAIAFMEKHPGIPRFLLPVLSSFTVTAGATIAVVPVLCALSGRLYLPVLLSNLIFSPLFTILLFFIPLFLITYAVTPLSAVVCFLINSVSSVTVSLASLFSSLPDMSISLAYDFVPFLIAGTLLATAVLCFTVKKLHPLRLIPTGAFLVVFFICLAVHNGIIDRKQSLTYICDDNNEALIFTDARDGLIIDFSDFPSSFVYEQTEALADVSPSVNCGTLMFTKFNSRHYAALIKTLEDITPAYIVLPENCEYTETVSSVALERGITVLTYSAGDIILWNGIEITTFASDFGDEQPNTDALLFDMCGKKSLFVRRGFSDKYDVEYGLLRDSFDLVIAGSKQDTFTPRRIDTGIFVSPDSVFPDELPYTCEKISGKYHTEAKRVCGDSE